MKNGTKKYLIVDDNDALRDMLHDLFRDDADILTAKNGQEALELVKRNRFDIIITDYNMPLMSGIEFLKRAQEINSDIYLHSILLTGSSDEEVSLFSECNYIPLILKPFSIFKLKEIVKALSERNQGDHLGSPVFHKNT